MLLLTSLAALGIRRHIEIAWQSGYTWIQECRELISNFPCLRLRALAAGSPGVPLGFHWGSTGVPLVSASSLMGWGQPMCCRSEPPGANNARGEVFAPKYKKTLTEVRVLLR